MDKIVIRNLTWPDDEAAELEEILSIPNRPQNFRIDPEATCIYREDRIYVLPLPSVFFKTALLNFQISMACPTQRISNLQLRMFYNILVTDWAVCHKFTKAFALFVLGCNVNDMNPTRIGEYDVRSYPRKFAGRRDLVLGVTPVTARRARLAHQDGKSNPDVPISLGKSAHGMSLDQVLEEVRFTPILIDPNISDDELYDHSLLEKTPKEVFKESKPVEIQRVSDRKACKPSVMTSPSEECRRIADKISETPTRPVIPEVIRFIAPAPVPKTQEKKVTVRPADTIRWLCDKALAYIDKGNVYYAGKLTDAILILIGDSTSYREACIQIQAGLSHANWTSVVAALRNLRERLK